MLHFAVGKRGSVASQGAAEPSYLIVGGGPEPHPASLEPLFHQADTIIAADGGWRLCRRLGAIPKLVVGDMDTLSPEEVQQAQESGSEIRRYPSDKDQSDLELAVEAAHHLGAQRLTLVGALGGEWDHCLGNLLAPLSRCLELGIWARLVTDSAEIYLLDPGEYAIESQASTRVSLAALSEEVEGLTLEGFAYELREGSLRRSQTLGLANHLSQSRATVKLRHGEIFLTLTLGPVKA